MRKLLYIFIGMLGVWLTEGCSIPRHNTATTRWLLGVNTRYNIYFNGYEAYKEALATMENLPADNYIELIPLHPVGISEDSKTMNTSFDRAIEKCVKAIQLRSLKIKPQRDRMKMRNPAYRSFVNQEEFNPFIHHVWLLLAKAQYYKGDFLNSLATHLYITRHFRWKPEVVAEAHIGMMENYIALDWLYEAEDVANRINAGEKLPDALIAPFAQAQAALHIARRNYKEAIFSLHVAFNGRMTKPQRTRLYYALGQLYALTDERANAYEAFGRVIRSSPPYQMEFNARIRQTEVYPSGNSRAVMRKLKRMLRDPKNRDNQSQLFFAMGNIKFSDRDTLDAIGYYRAAVDSSKVGGINKAVAEIALGDLLFDKRRYIEAQPLYSEAATLLKPTHKEYDRIKERADQLDELVVYAQNVRLQDSLQRLVRLPETERMAVINRLIADTKRKVDKEARQVKREELIAQQENAVLNAQAESNHPPSIATPFPIPVAWGGDNSWYFYNATLIAAGKTEFQKRWGRRKPEDDWRRRVKTVLYTEISDGEAPLYSDTANNIADNQSVFALSPDNSSSERVPSNTTRQTVSTDLTDPRYYLQQLPFGDDEIANSNAIIEEGLYNMAIVYTERMKNYALALETYDELARRFPDSEYLPDLLYNQYLIGYVTGDEALQSLKRNELAERFPESRQSQRANSPDYLRELTSSGAIQDSLYNQAYSQYLNGAMSDVQKGYLHFAEQYPQSKLIPKFLFLHALSFVPTGNTEPFRASLSKLVAEYEKSDVAPLSAEMLRGLSQGLSLAGGGTIGYGMTWQTAAKGISDSSMTVTHSTVQPFEHHPETGHSVVFIYPTDSVHTNMLLYEVARYNFNTFVMVDLDIEVRNYGETSMVVVNGFESYDEAMEYKRIISRPLALGQTIPPMVRQIVISDANLMLLTSGRTLDEYKTFFDSQVLLPSADPDELLSF